MRILSNLKSYFRRHISILLAFLVVMLLILCPVSIGVVTWHYSENLSRMSDNQIAMEIAQKKNNNLLHEQNRLLKKNNVLLLNMIFDLNDFHGKLKKEIMYFFPQDEEIE